jgi:mandelate racemase
MGYPTVQEDVAVACGMREAAGAEMAIMADYNQSLTPAEAAARARVLDDEDLTWVEEPTLAHDYARKRRIVTREARTPIRGGENWWGILDLQQALEAGASDFIMPDVMKIGGVTGWIQAASLARAKVLLCPTTCGQKSAPGSFAARRRLIGWNTLMVKSNSQ